MIADDKQNRYQDIIKYCRENNIQFDFVDYATFKNIIPNAKHQGIAARVSLLPQISLKNFAFEQCDNALILILDSITDPQNFGNILRSAAAFDVAVVIIPKDNSAKEGAVVAKAASGALDLLPIITVNNINNAITYLKNIGYWCYGLDQNAKLNISKANISKKSILVLGSEAFGIKSLTKKKCDFLLNIPINLAKMESLNVTNAASIAFYEIYKNFNI